MINKFLLSVLLFTSVSTAFAQREIDVLFDTPSIDGVQSHVIEEKLLELIDQAKPQSIIRISMYVYEHSKISQALLVASKRGVDVQLVLDGSNNSEGENPALVMLKQGTLELPKLICAENKDGKDGKCVKLCKAAFEVSLGKNSFGGACRGSVINHNKFYLFSELSDGTKSVVVQSSANLGDNLGTRDNDLLIIKNDPILFKGYLKYWSELRKNDSAFDDGYDFNSGEEENSGIEVIKAFGSPRMFGSDPILNTLEKIECKKDKKDDEGSRIDVVQSSFQRKLVAQKLAELEKQGCTVRVLALDDKETGFPTKDVKAALGDILLLAPDKDKENNRPFSLHAKLVLIKARFKNGNAIRTMVFTGSHNLDSASLRLNDEMLLRVEDQNTYNKYFEFVDKLYNAVLAAKKKN